ncbi:cytochrome B [Brevundimonas sp. AAP58]|uniref:cytochrome b n=1 Tax=Brevundimonas sp. AAP58 TaxID=1523422 RepID=UPI0006B8A6D9|nr:cytochrome b/b6 domain-containing protein [Brevundimonas sp. AAP58]KPF75590.1 cytochrome B [Brevundimonas sp. AAP58]
MTWKSQPDRYGLVAIAIHWTSAALIIGLMAAGFAAANVDDPATKALVLRLHAPLGVLVLLLTLARLLWWALGDRKPRPKPGEPAWRVRLAKATHVGLIFVTLGLAASGIALFALSGAAPIVFGGPPQALPDFWDFPPRYAHAVLARGAAVLIALHVSAALYHHVVLKDRLLSRMGIGR